MPQKILLVFFCLVSNLMFAQLEAHEIEGEGWAKGDFVEIGINAKGVYGAKTNNKPGSFHNNRETENHLFGFIANPLADNWVDYDGDFFTPGSPEEGFSIEINGNNYSNNNEIETSQIPGKIGGVSVLSSDCFDDTAQIFWEGNVQGLNIKRYYSVTKDGLFIQMTTVIKNISTETKDNVFFMHNVDPDNNQTLNGKFETDLQLISQASSPLDNISLVTASQDGMGTIEDMEGSFVSFYSREENARVTYGGFNNRSASAIWNGDSSQYVSTEGHTNLFVDDAISIAFNLNNIEPNEVKKFTYYYILKEVDENFVPFIVNAFQENPTICDGNDGKLTFSGLTTGELYTISYYDDGVFVPEETYTADSEGEVIIENLDAGIYSNIKITFSGCDTYVDTIYHLKDPEVPEYTFSKEDLTNCEDLDGVLTIHGLTPFTYYLVTYIYDGIPVVPSNLMANIDGNIVFKGIDRGVYSNFILEQNECVTASNEVIEIYGPDIPVAYLIPDQFYCDHDYDFITSIDFSSLDTFILGTDNPVNFNITYHANEDDVFNNVALSKTNYVSNGAESFTIYAKKAQTETDCYDYVHFNIKIQLPPSFEIEDVLLCVNKDNTTNYDYPLPTISSGLSEADHSFEWFHDGAPISDEVSNSLTINTLGSYSVEATAKATGCSIQKTVLVYPSGPPQILEVNITSLPFSNNHTVTISASGYGEYVYAIDNYPYQDSPTFTGVSAGYHEFHITDKAGCGSITIEKMVIDYMKFFTPNEDSYNDTWQIIGVDELKNVSIQIFDRYGKLLKELSPHGEGWNGTFNGRLMPASDYWFNIEYDDDFGNKRSFRAHFSLKR